MSPLTTSVESLDANKVRLRVAIPAQEFERAIDAAFQKLARQVKVPGFRPGKAPRQLLEARLGNEVAREQALRDSLPEYYEEAIDLEAIDAIAPPQIDVTGGEDTGDVSFDAVVEVRPIVELQGYDGLRVELPSPAVTDGAVDAQIDALRERFADLEDSTAPLADGYYATIDIKGNVDGEPVDALSVTDFLYEVGSGLVVDALDDELRGKRAGDILAFNDTLPERFGEHAGDDVAFQVLVKDTKRKVLPETSDEWVSEVSEFATLDELRDDARVRLDLIAKVQAQMALRDKVLESIVELVDVEVPDTLVSQEMERRLHDFVHRLQEQGATIDQYLSATGQTRDGFIASLRDGSTAAVRADLALRAVVMKESITGSDDEVDAEVARLAERVGEKPQKVRRDLERRGAIEAVRSDIARSKALQYVVEHARVVDETGQPIDLSLPEPPSPEILSPEASTTQEPEAVEESSA